MTFLKSQQKMASESNAQETTKSSQKNVGTSLQGKSKQDKPQKRFRGVCAICGQPKAGRGKLCMDCRAKFFCIPKLGKLQKIFLKIFVLTKKFEKRRKL